MTLGEMAAGEPATSVHRALADDRRARLVDELRGWCRCKSGR
jgi:hypothetical protein